MSLILYELWYNLTETYAFKPVSNPHDDQSLIHNYFDPVLIKEANNVSQLETVDGEKLLLKLFPDEVLPMSVDAAYKKLASGPTPLIRTEAVPGLVWFLSLKGITNAEKLKSNEQQVADFMQGVAEAVYNALEQDEQPRFFQSWTGRFCTVPLKTPQPRPNQRCNGRNGNGQSGQRNFGRATFTITAPDPPAEPPAPAPPAPGPGNPPATQ